ncbi:MAG: aminomethyl-transferring glycine dehydrogenase [Anaerolinea sp.]|nr:aminomethyl-transferring glycine dehydrogenase [Anaerolinea sp.]
MFIPHTDQETREMLEAVGVKNLAELFTAIPEKYRFPKLQLPPAMTEMEILAEMENIAEANESTKDLVCFLGAGAYNHYSPAAVDMLLRRGEFYTAYTPYQPEISQGTLQVIFEYQSLVTALTGMEASNASHYDGATSAAEAVILAYQNFRGKRNKIILSPSLNPQYTATIRTYTQGHGSLIILGADARPDGSPEDLVQYLDDDTALVIVQYPDFLGRLYDYSALIAKAHEVGALVAVAVNPLALALFKTPGDMGADIVVGEGQPLGLPLSYGGPYLGIFATRKEFIRKISGRLVGETTDSRGNRAYVLTLTAREQHIRREKASSNICTNQGLLALAATIYMSLLGKNGLKKVAELNFHKAHYAAEQISQIPGYSVATAAPFFNEFVVTCPHPADEVAAHLLEHGILGGYELANDYQGMDNQLLVAVTEMNSKDEIDLLCEVLAEVNHD